MLLQNNPTRNPPAAVAAVSALTAADNAITKVKRSPLCFVATLTRPVGVPQSTHKPPAWPVLTSLARCAAPALLLDIHILCETFCVRDHSARMRSVS